MIINKYDSQHYKGHAPIQIDSRVWNPVYQEESIWYCLATALQRLFRLLECTHANTKPHEPASVPNSHEMLSKT